MPKLAREEATKPYLWGGSGGFLSLDQHGPRVTAYFTIKAGKGTREIRASLSIAALIAFADAVRSCHHCYEDCRTGQRPKSMKQVLTEVRPDGEPRFTLRWEGHAIWHVENPDRVCPCLDNDTTIIDVPDPARVLDVVADEVP